MIAEFNNEICIDPEHEDENDIVAIKEDNIADILSANRLAEFCDHDNNAGSLYNPNHIDFKHEPMFLGSGRNTQRFDDPKYSFFDKSNDTQQGFDWKHDEIPLITDKKDFKSILKNAEKYIVTRNLQKLIFLDSIQGRGPLMIFGQITTLPELENVILTWEYFEGCLVPETQVMTSKGWKRIDMIKLTDKVMSVDLNGKGNFSEPEKLHSYESNGYITKFEGKNTSQFVTDQHRMLLQDRNTKDRKVKRVENITIHKDGAIKDDIINALSSTNNSIKLSDYDRFLIALQADGNIKREYVREDGKTIYKNQNGNRSNKISIVFNFVKDRKIIRMRKLLDDLHLEYSESIYKNDRNNDAVTFRVLVEKEMVISKSFNDWVNLEEISYDWSRQFCEELKYWDGWDYNNPTFGYDTIDKENADLVEIIGTIGGYKTSHSIKEGKMNEQPLHRLTFNSKKNYSIGRSIKAERIEYNGKVHCLTVDGGFFVIKHNGKISITGNCKHSRTYTEMLRAYYEKPDEIFDESFTLPALMKIASKIRSVYDRAYFNVIGYIYKEQRGLEYTQKELYDLKASIVMLWVEINILEGMRFYAGFAAMWGLKESQDLMSGLSENLQFICLHPETDVLTDIGWKKVEDLSLNDNIAQQDLETGLVSFNKPTRKIWRKYQGKMHKVVDANGKVIQHLTEDHEIVVSRKNSKTKKLTTSKVKIQNSKFNNATYYPQGGLTELQVEKELTTLEKFRIMVAADGYINPRSNGIHSGYQAVNFSLKKERKLKLFFEYCDKLNYNVVETSSQNDVRTFIVSVPIEVNISKNLDWFKINTSSKHIDNFLMELIKWDGSEKTEASYNKYGFFTSDKNVADHVIALISLSSYKSFNYKQKNLAKDHYKDSYKIYFRDDDKIINTQKYIDEIYNYDGMIGCVTMPKGTIITKSIDNKVCTTGNCRDENEHLALTQFVIKLLKKDESEGFTQIFKDLEPDIEARFYEAYFEEVEWINYMFEEGSYIGMNADILIQYLNYVTIRRMKAVGYKPNKESLGGLYITKNPIPWVQNYINMDKNEKLPQEEKILNYVTGAVDQNMEGLTDVMKKLLKNTCKI